MGVDTIELMGCRYATLLLWERALLAMGVCVATRQLTAVESGDSPPRVEVLSYGDKKVPKETLPEFSPLRGSLRCSFRSGVADRPSMA